MTAKLEAILSRLGLGELVFLFAAQDIDDSLLARLTDEDLQKIGVEKLGQRKKLLEAFLEAKVADVPASPPRRVNPATASMENPFANSLGQLFVPIPDTATLFCIWQVRVNDYVTYCQDTGAYFPTCDFEQGPEHPVVNVTWKEANAFCGWLTDRERKQGLIDATFSYRLPEDREWSLAVGLHHESGISPEERSGRAKSYPWGRTFPPPHGAGNYHKSLGVDGFHETAPVGCFPPNRLGIHDLGGNVWEWCHDEFERGGGHRVLRGASCFNDYEDYLRSSYRDKFSPDARRNNNGFRLVLSPLNQRGSWF